MRIARRSDIPALTDLWERCFGDPPAVIRDFFTSLWEEITVFQTEDSAAMLTAMPVTWQGKQAAYLYAVGTHPDRRGEGLCRKLMAFAEETLRQRGCSYAILSPAEESLFRFYEKLGYRTCFTAEQKTFSRTEETLSVFAVSAEEYGRLRENRMPNAVQYPLSLLLLQASMGLLLRVGENGCAAAERHGSGFLIRELLAEDAAQAASAVCRHCGADSLSCKLPGDAPYGMAKSLDGSPLSPSWLGLAFE